MSLMPHFGIRRQVRRIIRTLSGSPQPSSAKQRRWLLERMPKHSSCAEIGVWRGDFSAEILRVVRPRHLHLIDPWSAALDAEHAGALYATEQSHLDTVYETVRERFRDAIDDGRVTILRLPSKTAASRIPDESLDWIYIDGDHRYEAVKEDLEMYRRKVKPGGLVCGDDYGTGGWWAGGVKAAVDEIVADGRLELLTQDRRQFILRRPAANAPAADNQPTGE